MKVASHRPVVVADVGTVLVATDRFVIAVLILDLEHRAVPRCGDLRPERHGEVVGEAAPVA
jgi:hypothetical protein